MDVGFNNGTIKLNSSNNVYYSGQTITGDVVFKLLGTEEITALNIQFVGVAKVFWTETETGKRNGTTFKTRVDYKAQEEYFNDVQCLMGAQDVTELKAGPHSVSFQYQIPATAPSSYKAEKGEIIYEVRAYLEYSDVTKERGELAKIFEVVAPLDLNKEDPRIKQPLKLTFEESITCGCLCKPGGLRVEVEAGAGGAAAGQLLPVAVRATNDTRVEVKAVELTLLCKRRFRSQQPIAEICPEEELATVKTAPILSWTQRNYQLNLVIPDMIAPNLSNCSIMDVQYFLKATVKLSGCHNDLAETLPFYIGLKPANDFGIGDYVHPMAHSLPSGPIPDYPIISPTKTINNQIGFTSANVTSNETAPQTNYNVTSNEATPQTNYNVPSNETAPQTNFNAQYPNDNMPQRNFNPQYNKYDYNPQGFQNQQPNIYPVLNYPNTNPNNVYVPSQYPLNGHAPMVPVNYSPSAPTM